ncbi:50S ribosomal protein L25 [Patescibacteria group bacterium]
MNEYALVATRRSIFGKNNKSLRRENKLPAVIYGKGFDNTAIELPLNEFTKVWQKVGESTIIQLKVDKQEDIKVIIQEVQTDPLSGQVVHVDLHKINMNEAIEADVPLEFVDESPAIKEMGGVLVRNLDHIRIKTLPGNLVHDIPVSLSVIKTFEDIIRVKDLEIPEKITVLNELGDVVAKVSPPRTEEELKALDEEVKEDVEGVEKVEGEEEEAEDKEGETEEEDKKSDEPDKKEETPDKEKEKEKK